jgi:hypothetical protein
MQEQALDKFRDLFIGEPSCRSGRRRGLLVGPRHGLPVGPRHACRGKQFVERDPMQKFKVLAHL